MTKELLTSAQEEHTGAIPLSAAEKEQVLRSHLKSPYPSSADKASVVRNSPEKNGSAGGEARVWVPGFDWVGGTICIYAEDVYEHVGDYPRILQG